ncbi:MAG: CotH kinase family protein [Ruminococcus sp.]|nr:CotH kinase family protein [Ruminococcus sp.]
MKKTIALLLSLLMLMSLFSLSAFAAEEKGSPTAFPAENGLYAHAVLNADEGEAWHRWQSVHDEDFNKPNPNTRYFFLPCSADDGVVDVYNAFDTDVTVNGVTLAAKTTGEVPYRAGESYDVSANGTAYTLTVMRSHAEAAIYINNPDTGDGVELMDYLNADKSRSATATGAIVTPDGKLDSTPVKKIKGRGNTSWDKPKKGYNITYDKKVSIAGMEKNKKYSILANYQDDSLSRNRFLYDLSDAVGMPYASDSRYVDFYVNGYYWGSYLMTEKVEPGSLVPEVDDEGYLNEDGTLREEFPFIVEVDASAGDDDYWLSTKGLKLTIKSPELDDGDPYYDEVKDYVKTCFDKFYNATGSRLLKLSNYADVESVTKLWLINELGKNWDSGVSSTFFTYKQDENGTYKFYGSPVWDYDNSLGNAVGVARDLRSFGVTDYEKYTGWWCRYKGLPVGTKTPTNIMGRIAVNSEVLAAAPKIWFEKFVPAMRHFTGEQTNAKNGSEFNSREEYYSRVADSAAMNYTSGWLLDTGDWIADHSRLYPAVYDSEKQTMTVASRATTYPQTFRGMYDYCADWFVSRSAWLTAQFAPDYTPDMVLMGDADGSRTIDINDVTAVQSIIAESMEADERTRFIADVDQNGMVDIVDATCIQKYIAEIPDDTAVTGKQVAYIPA